MISRTRLKSFINFLLDENIIRNKEIEKIDINTDEIFKIRGTKFVVIEEGIYGLLSWKFRQRSIEETSVAFHIVDHCNLNCQMCNKFSCIADECFVSSNHVINDAKDLSRITGGKIGKVIISGGEPLLHPELENILIRMNEVFPNSEIQLQTNGVLLTKKDDYFFDVCRNTGTYIWITKYPIKYDYKSAVERCEMAGCKVVYAVDEVKTSWKFPMDINGNQPLWLQLFCWMHGECINIVDGKLWNCGFMHASKWFEKRFQHRFDRMPDDYLELCEVNDWADVEKYINGVQKFCRYCDICRWEENIPWKTSNKTIDEYT